MTLEELFAQKPYTKSMAIQYANELRDKYNKIYCVVNTLHTGNYDIVTLKYLSQHLIRYNVIHIAIL